MSDELQCVTLKPSLESGSGVQVKPASSPPYRLAAVCLGLLCAVLMIVIIALSIYFGSIAHSASEDHRSQIQTPSLLKEELDQLKADYSTLIAASDELKKEYSNHTAANRNLSREKMQLFTQLSKKFPILDLYCPIKLSTSQERICNPCPQGWKRFKSKCYYFSTDEMSWNESLFQCQSLGANLAIIKNKEQQNFIRKHTGGNYFWIGLTDNAKEGNWRWVDGSSVSETEMFWATGEPDNQYQEEGELSSPADCAVILPSKNQWADLYCDFVDILRVCETDALNLATV